MPRTEISGTGMKVQGVLLLNLGLRTISLEETPYVRSTCPVWDGMQLQKGGVFHSIWSGWLILKRNSVCFLCSY